MINEVAARRFALDSSLQRRLLAAVASGFVLAGGATSCGGQSSQTDDDNSSGAGESGSSGSGGTSSGGDGGTTSVGGMVSVGGTTSATGGAPTCSESTGQRECFTIEQLEYLINHPPMGGYIPPADAGPELPYIEVTDCLEARDVLNDCCIAASYGPEKEGELCCYTFCAAGCCGRPFVTGGGARLASVAERNDWLAMDLEGEREGLDPKTQEALATAWLDDARGEHASVASFARFTLELLGLGAPAELVRDAQRAALDEIEHARLCFAVVRHVSGERLGPGPFDAAGAAPRGSLAACAAAAVQEGCIGETIAAAVAAAERDGARDPVVRRALERIAADEERHAELAFRFVAWALATGGPDVRRAVTLAFEQALAGPVLGSDGPPGGVDEAAWRRFGRLAPVERREVARMALDGVIRPCAALLLD